MSHLWISYPMHIVLHATLALPCLFTDSFQFQDVCCVALNVSLEIYLVLVL